MALWFDTALIDGEWVDAVRLSHRDGIITAVEIGAPPDSGDEHGAIGLPGLANVHSHAFQRGMAGLAETRGEAAGGDSFWSWREVMYRFLDRLGPDDVEAIAALAYAEMLEAGFTRVGEFHYLHHAADGRPYDNPGEMAERIAAAAAETGMGLTLLPVFYAHGGFGGAPASGGQRRFLNTTESFGDLMSASAAAVARLSDAVLGLAPHSLRAATPAEILRILPLAGAGPIHIHIAEQAREVADCLAAHGAPPVAWLMGQAPVDARWCLVHATHVNDTELAEIVARGAVAGLCPITEANLGDGLFPASAFLDAGGAMAVGSDSNVLIDAAEELRLLEYGQRLHGKARNLLASPSRPSVGGRLFRAAKAGGAQALAGAAGSLAVGEPLDVVALDAEHPALIARRGDALLDGWVFAAGRGAVDKVWRRGRQVVSEGRHVGRRAIRTRYAKTLRRLLKA